MKKQLINKSLRQILTLSFLLSSAVLFAGKDEAPSMNYEKYVMPNGLQVVLHTDHSDPMISFAIMYHTGSSRETPGKTGFAHLFEHLLFGGSENAPAGTFDKVIESAGGSNNGFTSRDITAYFETFPKNALRKILWLESDRMGFFINSVTPRLLTLQQNVVSNEKRQGEDNSPYGFTDYVVLKNLYPAGHPYSWEVIGEMEDLRNATLDDVKQYYDKFYGPNNATVVIAGDFNTDSVKALMNEYFGEIKSHGKVETRTEMPVTLDKTVRLFHEDKFANVPEINLVWPSARGYSKDAYALDFLSRLLTDGKKTPLYKVLVKDKQLTSRMYSYNDGGELAGDFHISARANQGVSLDQIEKSIDEAFALFEKEGITDNDLERIKATSEKSFYDNIEGVNAKSIQLATYNTLLNDPGFLTKDIQNIKSVTKEDVMRVYEKYIKGKPHVVTSFVPKGSPELAAANSVPAGVKEEDINAASQVEIAETGDEKIIKTPSPMDRTKEPASDKDPQVNIPQIWNSGLKNGIKISCIENKELPVVSISFTIEGGNMQDDIKLPGVSNMVANLLPLGTKTRTPEELEEYTQLLGSTLMVSSYNEEFVVEASTLTRNFDKTIALIREILLEPRWDSTELALIKTRIKNRIIQNQAQPTVIASQTFSKLVYGENNILGYSPMGTLESVDKITMQDLKDWYYKNISPKVTSVNIAGNVTKDHVLTAFKSLGTDWKPVDVKLKNYEVPAAPEKSKIYFVDVPGSSQSVIYIGYPALSRMNPDFVKADFLNYRLGGSFTSIFNQILREEKGFTYGASSAFRPRKNIGPFIASTSVRSDATFETVKIFKEEMEKFRKGISPEDLQYIKDCMIKSDALRFETNNSLVDMLYTMGKYGFPKDYVKREEAVMKNMTLDDQLKISGKYIDPDKMYYVVVGDAATQMEPLEKIGFGKPVLLKK